jgi:hypothetical protein
MAAIIERILSDSESKKCISKEVVDSVHEKFQDWRSLDMIVVLGASMDQDPTTKQWRLGNIVKSDSSRLVGGHSRAVAAKQIYEQGFEGLFIVTGGMQTDLNGNKVSRAKIMANTITNKYNVPADITIAIGQDGHGNTLGNIEDTVNFLNRNSSVIKNGKIGLLTNEWHITRTLFMFKKEPFFGEDGVEIKPIIVEDILSQISKLHRRWVRTFQNLPEMRQREELEKSGIKAYSEGNYKPYNS